MSTPTPRYRLVSPDRLRMLMERTATGGPMSVRQLADAAGVQKSTIDGLLHQRQETVSADRAHAIAEAIGVDLLVVWQPVGRVTGDARIASAPSEVPA
ncbi:helix-turn-helix domain-containing protein [Streptomyces aidingensis]|uniref:Helix-turn-helix domain-containing protein n=1 Tax=Streptomyces aidingensis TaxID=910347 RepID=A0A1I1PS85_9ACTN|nr:helix-turn-helix transcriptional regulator [Streptomyces aidingensis]SFD12716.1 Helix-turn-helix domain-containing protein [Streptomyces aidingensis]